LNNKIIFKSLTWDFTSKIVKQFSGLFIGIYLARLLGPEDFGVLSLSMVFISLFGYLISTGLFSALIQKDKIDEGHLSSVFYFNILISLLLLIILFLLTSKITFFFNQGEEFELVLKTLSFMFLLSGLTQVQESLFRRNLDFKTISTTYFFSSFFSGLLGVFLAYNGYGIWSLVFMTIVEKVIITIVFWLKSNWLPKKIFKISSIKELWEFGFDMFLSGILNVLVLNIDSFIISKYFGLSELGYFNRAKTLNNFAVRYSSESIGSVMFPVLSKVQHNKKKFINLGLNIEFIIAFVSFGILGFLFLTAENLITLLLGDKWLPSIAIYKLLCLSGFAMPMLMATTSMLKASGKSRLFLKIEILTKVIGVLGMLIGFYFGMRGYLISLIITGFISVSIIIIITHFVFKTNLIFRLKNILIYPIISVFSVFCVYNIFQFVSLDSHFLNIIFKFLIFSALYLSMNFFLGTLVIKKIINKIKS